METAELSIVLPTAILIPAILIGIAAILVLIKLKGGRRIMECPNCDSGSTKVIYMGLPMRICWANKCNTMFGFWSIILYVVPFNGWLYSYEGNYIEGLIGWWKEMDGDGS